ncbi:PH domain-containing protein [Nocardia puris]|uniref:PH (Pleckstrin Homology) domain-containing protein n=1 Tax=Nocardia puris TaxID=208602 RepID=A0A366E3B1_9NOCA|nr:PH domain-containing protein [Nocardia puris]MBF6215364.1 PH domain-containing protein [Nocardia puris]MBF6369782.1 PH domain-containing protein [Nocardia puris]MBF6463441.1 PH domain-containing protein [Nocardia puris]RBO96861.1 PH (Pleckstrin Homology) domain-containing protein [Nocardia puris]
MSSPHQSVPPTESSHTAAAGSDTGRGDVKVIRVTRLNYLGVVVLALGVFIFIVGWPALLGWTAILPLFAIYWIERTRTVVSDRGLDLRTVTSSRHLDWDRIRGVSIPPRGWVRAHLTDDTEVKLPAVSYDQLRKFIEASKGRIPDLFAAAAEAARAEREAQKRAESAGGSADSDSSDNSGATGGGSGDSGSASGGSD